MSLQVWLPLNGNLHNQGLQSLDITNNGAISNDNGKIGKCYYFNNSTINFDSLETTKSICFWIKAEKVAKAAIAFVDYKSNLAFGFGSDGNIVIACGEDSSIAKKRYISSTFLSNVWTHIVLVKKDSDVELWINGILQTARGNNNYYACSVDKCYIGGRSTGANLECYLNDFRIYNHQLSEKEIKEISKGLILHYPLNRNGWGLPSNLLKNGFGELGTENWDKGVYTDDLPAIDTSIQARFQDSISVEYIPIYRNHTYRYSIYIKSSETSGSYYPSLLPYDRDYNFIAYRNCVEGFNLDTMTVLTQELKSGDNKIYVEDLSQWNANSGHYYNYAAIFSYADSTGYIYPDGVYTQNTPQFASGTNAKTNLDKTNNIITLIANYTGPTIPVGTHVCASTAGSQYFYPFGGIRCTSISNWTYKTVTFSSENDRLLNAKYVKISSYGEGTQAGILLEDITSDATLNGTIQYDISGYQNNGTKNNITYNSDAPKYNVSSVFNSVDTSYIKVNENNWMGQYATVLTVNAWVYASNWSNLQKLYSCTQTGGWGTTSAGSEGYLSFTIYVATTETKDTYTYKTNTKALKISDITPGWHMITFLYDSNIGHKIYLDGELHSFLNFTSYGVRYNESTRLFLGCEAGDAVATTPYFDGKFSDFRIYATALSEKDILSLYNNEAYIDQLNAIHGEIR